MAKTRVPRFIENFGPSYSMLSNAESVDTAVVFVHGFGGKPTSTWRDFHGLVDEYASEYAWWPKSDMFFFAYESRKTPIRRNAQMLGEFLESIWNAARHKHLILVGHSEGGVIIRRMILDRYEDIRAATNARNSNLSRSKKNVAVNNALKSDFVLMAHLKLFAPACMGTNFSSWMGFLDSFSRLVSAIMSSLLVRNELLPDSGILRALQAGTEKAHLEFPQIRSFYTWPIFGVPDQIVVSDSYAGEKLLWDHGWDHFGVCKPSYIHKRPLEFVRK